VSETVSVETFLDEWLATVKVRNAAGTHERYRVTVERFKKSIGPLAQSPLTAITPRQVEKFLTERLAAGLAPKTAIIEVKILKTAFGRAEVHDLIVKNPVRGLVLPKSTPSRREVFTHGEVQMLLDAAPDLEWQTVILLGYYLGARLTDCANMTWENIRPADGLIVYEQKKTGKEVIVPMHYHVIEHLTHVAEFGTEGPLCPSLASKKPGGKAGLSEAFKRIMKRAGIDAMTVQGKGVRKFSKRSFHSLRHSFNSALANAGVGQELRMKLTGHSSTAMNDQYTHFNVQALKQAVTALPLFEGEAGEP
jgi:integrase